MTFSDLTNVRIPLPWALFIALQTGGGFYWVATLEAKVDDIEARGSPQVIDLSNRTTRLEARFDSLRSELDRLENTATGRP
jgi:hypothetical protein